MKHIETLKLNDVIQQGDVILTYSDLPSLDHIPMDEMPTLVCHTGNNHFHTFSLAANVKGNSFYVQVRTILGHPEHEHISLPIGTYTKTIVKEYDHFLEESREVID